MEQEQKTNPKQKIIKRTGILFALYAAYNIFVLIRDNAVIGIEGRLISALVAMLFGVLTAFAWTADVQNIVIIMVRKAAFITAMITIVALKLRMAGKVIMYLDFKRLNTILYGASYFLFILALIILVVYYAFILKNLPLYPIASLLLPGLAMVFFIVCFVLDAVFFFVFNIPLEANWLRTVVMRPIFYLSFISLSVYFLFPPMVVSEEEVNVDPDGELADEYDEEGYDDEEEYDEKEYGDEEYGDEEYDDEEYGDEEYDDDDNDGNYSYGNNYYEVTI